MRRSALLLLSLTLALGACQRLGFSSRVDPLPASPTRPVASNQLQPVDLVPDQPTEQPTDETNPDDPTAAGEDQPGETEVAAAEPVIPKEPENSKSVGRTDMLGGWAVASGGDRCQLFMTLTTWSGGYRATTRGCSSETLKGISAWDLNGKQVVLKDSGGTRIASLYATGAERFNGQTTAGSAISVSR